MTESEPLTEGSYVYTDLGIERVHWCEVNGEKELVTPKGYILGSVLDFDTHARLVTNNIAIELCKIKLKEENTKLKKLLKECCYRINWTDKTGHKPTDDRKQKLFNDIDQVLKENE